MRRCLLTLFFCLLVLTPAFAAENAGALDTTFRPQFQSGYVQVSTQIVAPDGSLYLAAQHALAEVGGKMRSIIHLLADGAIDQTWQAGGQTSSLQSSCIALDGAGRLLVAYSKYNFDTEQADHFLCRLTATGAIDPAFAQVKVEGGSVHAIALQTDGQILAGGSFFRLNGSPAQALARISPEGVVDPAFRVQDLRAVGSLALQKDGRILVADFDNQLWRLSPKGVSEKAFKRRFKSEAAFFFTSPKKILIDSEERIIFSGRTVYRILPDGTLDPEFTSPAPLEGQGVRMALEPDDRIVFSQNAAAPRRMLEDGSFDPTFSAAPLVEGEVATLAVSAAGDIYMGGHFNAVEGQPHRAFAKLFGNITSTFFLKPLTGEVVEGPGRMARFTVSRKGRLDLAASVRIHTLSGSATAGTDFSPLDLRLVFAPGVASQTVTVPILDDSEFESPEEFQIVIDEPQPGEIGGAGSVTVRIADQPQGTIGFARGSVRAAEGLGAVKLMLLREGGSEGSVSVEVGVIGGSAQEALDFAMPGNRTVTFLPGVTSQSLVIGLIDDVLVEPAETVVLGLQGPVPGAVPGPDEVATLTIVDADTWGERAGTYTGLVKVPGLDEIASLSLTLAPRGAVTGRIFFGARSVAVRGTAAPDGLLTLTLGNPRGTPDLQLQLRLTGEIPVVSGSVKQSAASGPLLLEHQARFAKSTPSAAAGRYTAALPPATGAAPAQGWGWLTLEVQNSGRIVARGLLPNGTAISTHAALSMSNQAVLYAAPRSGLDRFSATLFFQADSGKEVRGEFIWTRSLGVDSGSLVHTAAIHGSLLPPETRLPSNGQLRSFPGGGSEPLSISFTQPRPGQFLFPERAASLQFTGSTGQFTGRLPAFPPDGKPAFFKGIWNAKENRGYGSFLSPASGAVEITDGE